MTRNEDTKQDDLGLGGNLRFFDPYLNHLRWPDLRIDSTAFAGLPAHERFYQLSQGYLKAAEVLCENAGNSGQDLSWPAASACFYCRYLGTELFLKACIARVSSPCAGHDLGVLYKKYRELLPGSDFEVPVGLAWRPSDAEVLLGREFQGVDAKPDEAMRYSADRAGRPPSMSWNFVPGYQLNLLIDFQLRCRRIWSALGKPREK